MIRGATFMKYIQAQDVLPEEIIQIIQQYVSGDYLYIPCKEGDKKSWGEKSGSKKMLKTRNNEIYHKYLKGRSVEELSEEFYLSEQSIRRILSEEKRRA